ncbi:MAG: hypothetical protein SNF33_00180 (plasmid) [Candidatus Algichlamydia australiensis]|nr:hypothetical protein [Chlamydiales bacterium]
MSLKKVIIHIYAIFSQWLSRGILGFICFQDDSTRVLALLFALTWGIGSIVQGKLSDEKSSRKKIILITQCSLVASCILAYFGIVRGSNEIPIVILATSLVLNGAFGNSSPALTAHIMDCGVDQKKAISWLLVTRQFGLVVGILVGLLSAKLALGMTVLANCSSLFLMHKLFATEALTSNQNIES